MATVFLKEDLEARVVALEVEVKEVRSNDNLHLGYSINCVY